MDCPNHIQRTKSSIKKWIIVRRDVRSMFGEQTFAQLRTGLKMEWCEHFHFFKWCNYLFFLFVFWFLMKWTTCFLAVVRFASPHKDETQNKNIDSNCQTMIYGHFQQKLWFILLKWNDKQIVDWELRNLRVLGVLHLLLNHQKKNSNKKQLMLSSA